MASDNPFAALTNKGGSPFTLNELFERITLTTVRKDAPPQYVFVDAVAGDDAAITDENLQQVIFERLMHDGGGNPKGSLLFLFECYLRIFDQLVSFISKVDFPVNFRPFFCRIE